MEPASAGCRKLSSTTVLNFFKAAAAGSAGAAGATAAAGGGGATAANRPNKFVAIGEPSASAFAASLDFAVGVSTP